MNRFVSIIFIFLATVLSFPAFAYQLPNVHIEKDEWNLDSETVLETKQNVLEEMKDKTSITRLKEHLKDPKKRLTKEEKDIYPHYVHAVDSIDLWNYVTQLKKDLIAMYPRDEKGDHEKEADMIAKLIIERLYDVSQRWKIGGSALFNNFLIRVGAKKGGFCYQYVEELFDALDKFKWKYYDIRWGEAWPKSFRENNALIITAHQKPFETGIAVDAWRTAGRPFWVLVKKDRFPWKEASE